MNPTSLSLLDRLQTAAPDALEWNRLHDIYLPLIRSWLRRVPEVANEAEDLAQDVLVVLFRKLPLFRHQHEGSFRGWLRKITLNRIRSFRRARRKRPLPGGSGQGDDSLAQLEDPTSDLTRQWDQEHDKHVFDKLLAIIRPDFPARTWEAFTRFAIRGRPAAEVAAELGVSEKAVVQARYRILRRLREEGGGLLD